MLTERDRFRLPALDFEQMERQALGRATSRLDCDKPELN